MAKFGYPARFLMIAYFFYFLAMVRQFHDGMLARLQNDREYTLPFPAINSKKGDPLEARKSYK